MRADLNFSPKPFVRRDPLRLLLILVNTLLLTAVIMTGIYYISIERSHREQSDAFSQIEQKKELLQERFTAIQDELQGMDLRAYDRELKFYASIQQEMNVPWTLVMDQLGEIIPDGVRIQKLASDESGTVSEGSQLLQFLAFARSKKAQLTFMSALRQHPSFHQILLKSELYEGPQLQFEFSARYHQAVQDPGQVDTSKGTEQ